MLALRLIKIQKSKVLTEVRVFFQSDKTMVTCENKKLVTGNENNSMV